VYTDAVSAVSLAHRFFHVDPSFIVRLLEKRSVLFTKRSKTFGNDLVSFFVSHLDIGVFHGRNVHVVHVHFTKSHHLLFITEITVEQWQGFVDTCQKIFVHLHVHVLTGKSTCQAGIVLSCLGKEDILVASVGTGGTLSGIGRYLKEQNPSIHVVAVEPDASPLLSGGQAAPHGIQGIGANFIPDNLDRTVYDEVIRVRDDDAYTAGRNFCRREGILVGISSGAALWAAGQLAKQPEHAGKTIVAILPDSGDRYLSSPMFND